MSASEAGTFDRIASPYDRGMAPLEKLWLRRMRARLLPWARGRVLEVGVGTGVNLPLYPDRVSVVAIDESAEMLAVAQQRALRHVHLARMDAERLAFADATFDTVVTSLVLCSVVEPERALGELRRVLSPPGGRLLLLEHMRPWNRPLALLVDLANVPWYAFNGRCHLNRRTQDAVAAAGFSIEHVEGAAGGFLRLIVATC
ncbi:MAG TPA: methyltransferase domain-containing protein [Anaerolineae bacterium]|nr:methyltransferase domain-containing protein [Anaerolineae bacterium]